MSRQNIEQAKQYLGRINGHRIRRTMDFEEFLELLAVDPTRVLRNVFQLFHDMITTALGQGLDEYSEDSESIHYVHYDCSRLFVQGVDYPFFADRLLANRLVNLVKALKRSAQQNTIYIFKGPPGSGKSTFLNTLLQKFEEYTGTPEGLNLRTVWTIPVQDVGSQELCLGEFGPDKYLEVPCPSYDHPVLMIPKPYRPHFFQALFQDTPFLDRLMHDKEYDWVLRGEPCTICSSLYQALLERIKDSSEVFSMVRAQPYQYNRRLGEGINVFMSGDKPLKDTTCRNEELQRRIDSVLGDSNRVKYISSQLAKTNNGIYALMDIKNHNKTRLMELHNIISEGVHKVEDIEERVNSLFLAIMNPEDLNGFQEFQSFEDRIEYIKVPYVMDLNTEVTIYRNIFGHQIETSFLPMVLPNFARMVIASRLTESSPALSEWIQNPEAYRHYCDRNLHLLKIEIYAGHIPTWLKDKDRKRFTSEVRRKIIAEGEVDGEFGISGRESIKIFNDFYSRYAKSDRPITMNTLQTYFQTVRPDLLDLIPGGFLQALVRLYNYTVLQEVKEAMYAYNEERISKDIQNYLFAINFELGSEETCTYTGERIQVTKDYLASIERRLVNGRLIPGAAPSLRQETQKRYTSQTLPQEIIQDGKPLTETQLYRELFERYVHNLKENVLDPFLANENFRRAIKDFGSDEFRSYDKRIQAEVKNLIHNLQTKWGYQDERAQEVCIYVIDNDLVQTFDRSRP